VVEVEGREETKVVEIPAFEPMPWGPDAQLGVVGQGTPRVDAPDKVTGRARYTSDLTRPGQLYAAIVRSSVARGRVIAIDTEEARRSDAVIDVMTGADLPALPKPIRIAGVP